MHYLAFRTRVFFSKIFHIWFIHFQQLQFKDQCSSSRNKTTGPAISVRQFARNVQLPLGTFPHPLHRFCPSPDHLVRSKCRGTTSLVTGVKLCAVGESAGIMTFTGCRYQWRFSVWISRTNLLVKQSRWSRHHSLNTKKAGFLNVHS